MLRSSRFLLAAIAVASLCLSAAASAQRTYDPPGRVARISDRRGDVAYSPAGDGEWYSVSVNRTIAMLTIDWAMRARSIEARIRGSHGTLSSAR